MSLNGDGKLDTDEALRLLDLYGAANRLDMVMSIENRGTPIEGESERRYGDGKPRMDLLGYDVHAGLSVAPGSASAALVLSHLHVVRKSDAATASIASLLRNQAVDLRVTVSVFRAGGDNIGDSQPMLEFVFENARVAEIALLTGGAVSEPSEVIRFGYRVMKISSASQQGAGQRGAVRTCELQGRG